MTEKTKDLRFHTFQHHALDDMRNCLADYKSIEDKILYILHKPYTTGVIAALIQDHDQALALPITHIDAINYALINMQHDGWIAYDKATKRYSSLHVSDLSTLAQTILSMVSENPASRLKIETSMMLVYNSQSDAFSD